MRASLVPKVESRSEIPFPRPPNRLRLGCRCTLLTASSVTGPRDWGDGPASAGLNPPPANLLVHVPLHPDRALFGFIHDGIEGAAMPALGETLSDDEVWHLVNYIRTLE